MTLLRTASVALAVAGAIAVTSVATPAQAEWRDHYWHYGWYRPWWGWSAPAYYYRPPVYYAPPPVAYAPPPPPPPVY